MGLLLWWPKEFVVGYWLRGNNHYIVEFHGYQLRGDNHNITESVWFAVCVTVFELFNQEIHEIVEKNLQFVCIVSKLKMFESNIRFKIKIVILISNDIRRVVQIWFTSIPCNTSYGICVEGVLFLLGI